MIPAKRVTQGLVAAFALVAVANQFTYTVQPSDMANVRRMGNMLYEEPVGEGLHFKVPLIDKVDHVQVDLRTLHIPPFIATTIDNQQITVEMNFNYTVPKESVNHLLYGVGRAGGGEVDSKIISLAQDRAGRVLALQNTTLIPKRREEIQKEITDRVFEAVQAQFGIEPHSLQIQQMPPSDAFVRSNEQAVIAKNKVLLEQNNERIRTAQAEQAVITADGARRAAIEAARGASDATRILAEADRQKRELEGQGQAALTEVGIEVFASPEMYNRYLAAKAALNWNGVRPQVSVSGGGTAVVVPALPAPTR